MAAMPHTLREFLFLVGMLAVGVATLACARGDLSGMFFVLFPGHVGLVLWYRSAEMLRRERRAKGLCLGCGYDLRATPSRCPECGRESPAFA
jgi:hypothetical protein